MKAITEVDLRTQGAAAKAVNVALTCRNWLIGAYVHGYELSGRDRAEYGGRLFEQLALQLAEKGIANCNRSPLYRYRDFYQLYPQIGAALSGPYAELVSTVQPRRGIVATSPLSGQLIMDRLSYSRIELLLELDDKLKRAFYAGECIRGDWSVGALKRQIATLYFERSGLFLNKQKVAARGLRCGPARSNTRAGSCCPRRRPNPPPSARD